MPTFRDVGNAFARASAILPTLLEIAGETIGKQGVKRAKEKIGTYQPAVGPYPAWEALSESTIADKSDRGYETPAPLLREGELRDSITYKSEIKGGTLVVELESNSPYSGFHEYGTVDMPARPFLGPALWEVLPPILDDIGASIGISIVEGSPSLVVTKK